MSGTPEKRRRRGQTSLHSSCHALTKPNDCLANLCRQHQNQKLADCNRKRPVGDPATQRQWIGLCNFARQDRRTQWQAACNTAIMSKIQKAKEQIPPNQRFVKSSRRSGRGPHTAWRPSAEQLPGNKCGRGRQERANPIDMFKMAYSAASLATRVTGGPAAHHGEPSPHQDRHFVTTFTSKPRSFAPLRIIRHAAKTATVSCCLNKSNPNEILGESGWFPQPACPGGHREDQEQDGANKKEPRLSWSNLMLSGTA